MALRVRVSPGGSLGPHYYRRVAATYTVRGRWRNRGKGFVAEPGDVVVAPAGSTHIHEAVGDDPVEAFVHLAHCALRGIDAPDITQ
jgi:quercetin dioxygenase-like cupin family protein